MRNNGYGYKIYEGYSLWLEGLGIVISKDSMLKVYIFMCQGYFLICIKGNILYELRMM